MNLQSIGTLVLLALLCGSAVAQQNDTFATATLLPPGVLSAADELTLRGVQPDPRLGIRTTSDEIIFSDDVNSIYGNGLAPGLQNLPIHSSSIRFLITGTNDFAFAGDHEEAGEYEVFVDVFGPDHAQIDAFSQRHTLGPGIVHEFNFFDNNWSGGTYNVNVDNTVTLNDVDFFTFTGLVPGTAFIAQTLDPEENGIDTLLGQFDDAGELLAIDDDGGGGLLSMIDGFVPDSGQLTFAVTGFGDDSFAGHHNQSGGYHLQLTATVARLVGDYNHDSHVDAADYTVWRDTLGQQGSQLAADGNGNGEVDAEDYALWKSHFGASSAEAAAGALAVPEPASWHLPIAVIFAIGAWRRSR